jgi:hypothetical protein
LLRTQAAFAFGGVSLEEIRAGSIMLVFFRCPGGSIATFAAGLMRTEFPSGDAERENISMR